MPEHYIQGCCVSEDEMEKEITLAFLRQQLKKLTPQEIWSLVRKYLDDTSAQYDWEYDERDDNWQTIMDGVE